MINLSNESIIHVQGKELEYLQFKRLLEYPEIVHCYTLGINNFDVAGNSTMENRREFVINNYEKLAKELSVNYNHIIRPYQTHTDIVKKVDVTPNEIQIFPKEYWDVDGLLTNKKDITLSLGYADCTPLFLYDPVKKVIGNIHSGWKGTLQRIGQKAVYKMIKEYGCNSSDILCFIGPCIKKCHFEVEKDVKEMFYNEFLYTGEIKDIIEKKNNKYYIDTTLINKLILQEAGLSEENIVDSKICTACNSTIMHSFRVDKELAGRNTAIIGVK